MKKLLFMLTAVALLFAACNKDKDQDQVQEIQTDDTGISFTIEQSDFNFKSDDPVPECNDLLDMNYVVFILDGVTYTSEIVMVNDEHLTQVIKLPDGAYMLTSFLVYSNNGTPDDLSDDVIVRAAPLPGSEYHDLMQYPLDIEVIIEPFFKKQVPVDVLCFEPLFYNDFGFTWFQYHDVRIEYQCIFGDICVDDFAEYDGSLYEQQANGIQFDIPAIFEIHVYKAGDESPLRVFSNAAWLGEGSCLPVYWPNRLDVAEEVFYFELWVLLPTLNGFEYVLMDTWEFMDGEGANTGEDGVVDFVIGDCQLDPADYNLDYSTLGTGDVQVTLTWNTTADIDLWVTDPFGELIKWNHSSSASGGILDYDDTDGFGPENIFWPPNSAPPGEYFVQVHHYSGEYPTDYTVQILFFGDHTTYTGTINDDELHDIATLNTSKNLVTPLTKIQKLDPMPLK